MPYLDMTDPDNFTHLLQLFLAAHPRYREENAQVRAQVGDPSGHFLSQPMLRALVAWGRERHLLRRKDAARLLETARYAYRTPAEVVTLTPRVMGTPPRLQPTVMSTDLYTWLYLADADPAPEEQVAMLTISAALTLLEYTIQDATEPEPVRARAQQLHAWLADHVSPARTDA